MSNYFMGFFFIVAGVVMLVRTHYILNSDPVIKPVEPPPAWESDYSFGSKSVTVSLDQLAEYAKINKGLGFDGKPYSKMYFWTDAGEYEAKLIKPLLVNIGGPRSTK